MFVKKIIESNPRFVETVFDFHQNHQILPDSYVVDMDTLRANAIKILDQAKANNIKLYFMLKQLGRNPLIAKELMEIGYEGAVVVDFKEAQVMMKHHIPIGNIGHLVQIPSAMMEEVVAYGCEIITVYSYEKCCEISEVAKKLGMKQSIMLRVYDDEDMIYPGQTAGFKLDTLRDEVERIKKLENVVIDGVTSFPCYIYQEDKQGIVATKNLETVLKSNEFLKTMGIHVNQVNTPSSTCVSTIPQMAALGATHGEPGHGLSGTTPAHASKELDETPCVLYLSEISHNFEKKAYCYGGGNYRRSHMKHACVGTSIANHTTMEVTTPSMESIDYHFELENEANVGDSVIMAFRFQIFVTRSDVVLVRGIHTGNPSIVGVYDSLGNEK